MKKKATTHTYKSAREFGRAMGLTEVEMNLVEQKKRIIEKLKKARLAQEISQVKLAKLIGTKQPAIARMESGLVSEVSLDFLAKIAFALEVSFTIKKAA